MAADPEWTLVQLTIANMLRLFGATALMIGKPDEIAPGDEESVRHSWARYRGRPFDYSDKHKLFDMMDEIGFIEAADNRRKLRGGRGHAIIPAWVEVPPGKAWSSKPGQRLAGVAATRGLKCRL
jgi:hypothetical protein